jgi:hypothetical protein
MLRPQMLVQWGLQIAYPHGIITLFGKCEKKPTTEDPNLSAVDCNQMGSEDVVHVLEGKG